MWPWETPESGSPGMFGKKTDSQPTSQTIWVTLMCTDVWEMLTYGLFIEAEASFKSYRASRAVVLSRGHFAGGGCHDWGAGVLAPSRGRPETLLSTYNVQDNHPRQRITQPQMPVVLERDGYFWPQRGIPNRCTGNPKRFLMPRRMRFKL